MEFDAENDVRNEQIFRTVNQLLSKYPKRLFDTDGVTPNHLSVQKLHAIFGEMKQMNPETFSSECSSFIDGACYKKSGPFRHIKFWKYAKSVRRIRQMRISALITNINERFHSTVMHLPTNEVILFVTASLIEKMHRLCQVRICSLLAADEMIGHLEQSHWMAMSRLLIAFLADISSTALRELAFTKTIFQNLRQWINGHFSGPKSWLNFDVDLWLQSGEGIRTEGFACDPILLSRLLSVTESDVVMNRIEQALLENDNGRQISDWGEIVADENIEEDSSTASERTVSTTSKKDKLKQTKRRLQACDFEPEDSAAEQADTSSLSLSTPSKKRKKRRAITLEEFLA